MYTVSQQHQKALSPRKKKRKYSSDNNTASFATANSFDMIGVGSAGSAARGHPKQTTSIVDRVIDLSKYDSKTGLYTLTRDWMDVPRTANPVSGQQTSTASTDDSFVTSLPGPIRDETTACITIEQLNAEIGKQIRSGQADDLELIKSLNLNEAMETRALCKLHVGRWKSCRRKWIDYYEQSNRAYKNSSDLLKSLYEEMQ
jgi:hypothetical protein